MEARRTMPEAVSHNHDFYEILELFLRSTVPLLSGLILLLGGIWILSLPLPGWKLVLGLPAAQLGIIVLMFTFDGITKRKLHPENYQIIICPFCSSENLVKLGSKHPHCVNCQKDISPPQYPEYEDED